MNFIKVYRLGGSDLEVTPGPTDIIQFESGSIACVTRWDENGYGLKTLHTDYVDRGWFFRLLEGWGWISPEDKDREINITSKAYLIGSLQRGMH